MSAKSELEKSVLTKLAAGELTADQALAMLHAPKVKDLTVKVSPDGKKVAIYGAQKFPITHWPQQWKRILDGVTAPEGTVVAKILALCAEVEAAGNAAPADEAGDEAAPPAEGEVDAGLADAAAKVA